MTDPFEPGFDAKANQYNAGGEAGKFMYNYEPNDCSKWRGAGTISGW
ncbi:MAG: hypothetical protein HC767_09335 [Akkermansiaceae bacterium]|nr:hypothetical protein [Akkermansiaceae bacterium]